MAFNNSFEDIHTQNNTTEIKEKILSNTINDLYLNLTSKIKNDVCPISLEAFEKNDEISMFSICFHGIKKSHLDQFVTLFNKCPLCNCDLIH